MTKQSDNRETEIMNLSFDILKKHLHPEKIILFGSRGKNKSARSSDFDFAVDCEAANDQTRQKVNDELEKISGLYSVDVVYLREVDNDFKNIIMKTGQILYER